LDALSTKEFDAKFPNTPSPRKELKTKYQVHKPSRDPLVNNTSGVPALEVKLLLAAFFQRCDVVDSRSWKRLYQTSPLVCLSPLTPKKFKSVQSMKRVLLSVCVGGGSWRKTHKCRLIFVATLFFWKTSLRELPFLPFKHVSNSYFFFILLAHFPHFLSYQALVQPVRQGEELLPNSNYLSQMPSEWGGRNWKVRRQRYNWNWTNSFW